MRVTSFCVLVTLLGMGSVLGGGMDVQANPIRKVVTLLQDMQNEIAAEGEKEKELYDKFMCFCEQTNTDLGDAAAKASSNIDEVSAKLEEDSSSKSAIDQELIGHKQDRADAKSELDKATAIRGKEAEEAAASIEDDQTNIAAVSGSIPALEKGMGAASFMQTQGADRLKRVVQSSSRLNSFDRDNVVAFLEQRANGDYVPQSGQIVGILKNMLDEMQASLKSETADEAAAVAAFADLKSAKTKEIEVASAAIETKAAQSGELAVLVVQSKDALADAEAEKADAEKYLASLKISCTENQKQWTARQAMRAEEVSAISEAINILNDDDALDIFKQSLPSAFLTVGPNRMGFLQSHSTKGASLRKAAALVQNAAQTYRSNALQLLSFSLKSRVKLAQKSGVQVSDFKLIDGLLDQMVARLEKEGEDDTAHKAYCESEFAKSAASQTSVEENLAAQGSRESELADQTATLAEEASTLEVEIKALDGAVAQATLQRKSEHSEFTEMMTLNEAAVQLIEKAKQRLYKFYNPVLYKAPPKKELTMEEKWSGGAALVQVRAHGKVAPPIPPATFDAYTKKGDKNQGVISLMDMLSKELKSDMAAAEHDEKTAQAEYQDLMNTSAETRAQNAKGITDKEAAKATLEAKLIEVKESKMLTAEELMQVHELIGTLHQSCDFIMDNFELRTEARINEAESLKNAKSVLAGANFA